MKKTKYKNPIPRLRNKADKNFQIIGMKKHKHCLVCGMSADCLHHFITKGACASLRYDDDNGIPICTECHCKHHLGQDPTISITIREKMGDEWYARINEKKKVKIKTNVSYYRSIIEDLEEQLLILENQ